MDRKCEILINENSSEKIVERKKIFCPFCEQEHEVELVEFIAQDTIKNSLIKYKAKSYKCGITNELFENGELLNKNLEEMREQYRIENNLLTKQQIKNIREKYGLTQEELAIILAFGEKTIARYETTGIQERAYDILLREFSDNYDFALEMLKQSQGKINQNNYATIYNRIVGFISLENFNKNIEKCLADEYITYDKETTLNGKTLLDIGKIKNMLIYFARNVKNLFEVKLMKLFWYADAMSYVETGKTMTGLVYTHQKFGALPIGYEYFTRFGTVVQDDRQVKNYMATEFKPKTGYEFDDSLFSSKEIEILNKISKRFRDCTGKELSDIMHNEDAYQLTNDKEIIDFSLIKDLKAIN